MEDPLRQATLPAMKPLRAWLCGLSRSARGRLIAAVLGSASILALAQVLQNDDTLYDEDRYDFIMEAQVESMADLAEWARYQVADYIRIVPGDLRLTQPGTDALLPFETQDLPASFLSQLAGQWESSVPVFPIEIAQDFTTGVWTVWNAEGEPIAQIQPPGGVSPRNAFLASRPDFYSSRYTQEQRDEMLAEADVSRIHMLTKLIEATNVVHYLYAEQQAADYAAQQQELNGGMQMLMGGGSVTELVITAQSLTETGTIAVTVSYPDDFTNRVDVFCSAAVMSYQWWIAVTNRPTTNDVGGFTWYDTSPDGELRFYTAANADIDSDGDGLNDARERMVYHSYLDDTDSDNDGLSDGYEFEHRFDPMNADTNAPAVTIASPGNGETMVVMP